MTQALNLKLAASGESGEVLARWNRVLGAHVYQIRDAATSFGIQALDQLPRD